MRPTQERERQIPHFSCHLLVVSIHFFLIFPFRINYFCSLVSVFIFAITRASPELTFRLLSSLMDVGEIPLENTINHKKYCNYNNNGYPHAFLVGGEVCRSQVAKTRKLFTLVSSETKEEVAKNIFELKFLYSN